MSGERDATGGGHPHVEVSPAVERPGDPLPALRAVAAESNDAEHLLAAAAQAASAMALMALMDGSGPAPENLRQLIDAVGLHPGTPGGADRTAPPVPAPAAALLDAAARRPPHPAQLAADLRGVVVESRRSSHPATPPPPAARPAAGRAGGALAPWRWAPVGSAHRARQLAALAGAGLAALLVVVLAGRGSGPAASPSSPAPGARSEPCTLPTPVDADPTAVAAEGDLDGDGCPEQVRWWPAAAVVALPDGQRFALGRPGDQLVLGDWDADGRSTPALYRPATGTVLRFDRWATDGDVSATASDAGVTGGLARVESRPSGDEVVVVGPPPR